MCLTYIDTQIILTRTSKLKMHFFGIEIMRLLNINNMYEARSSHTVRY